MDSTAEQAGTNDGPVKPVRKRKQRVVKQVAIDALADIEICKTAIEDMIRISSLVRASNYESDPIIDQSLRIIKSELYKKLNDAYSRLMLVGLAINEDSYRDQIAEIVLQRYKDHETWLLSCGPITDRVRLQDELQDAIDQIKITEKVENRLLKQ